jgi:hypothetical protein
MEMTTTMQHRGQMARRARRVAPWRVAGSFLGCGTTGVDATPNATFAGNTTDTIEPAGGTWFDGMIATPHARHLGARST